MALQCTWVHKNHAGQLVLILRRHNQCWGTLGMELLTERPEKKDHRITVKLGVMKKNNNSISL